MPKRTPAIVRTTLPITYCRTNTNVNLLFPRPVWIVLGLSLAWRLTIATLFGPGFDEAYYYAYSLRPALSYFDHPPLVGYVAGFFPNLTGIVSGLTIRLGAVLLFTASGLFLYALARQFGSEREALFTYILYNLTPLFMVVAGTMILPDAGLVFFWTLALLILAQMFIREDYSLRNWVAAGLLTGFAMLAKYHGALLGMSVMVLLLLRAPRRFLTPGPYVYGLAAVAGFSPVLIWNWQNSWISFSFQGGRADGGSFSMDHVLQAVGGQVAYLTPFIALPLAAVIVGVLWKAIRRRETAAVFFTAFGVLPLLPIVYASLFSQILPHWTLPGYIVLMIPLGVWLADLFRRRASVRVISWITIGFIVILLGIAVLHMRFGILHLERWAEKGWITQKDVQNDITLDAVGWEQVGPYIDSRFKGSQVFLFTHKWFLSGEVDMAVRGQYPVLCFNDADSRGYGLWDAKLDMRGKDGLLISTDRFSIDARETYGSYFRDIAPPESLVVYRGAVRAKVFYFVLCRSLISRYPLPYQERNP